MLAVRAGATGVSIKQGEIMKNRRFAVSLCVLSLAAAACLLGSPAHAKFRWMKVKSSTGGNLCMNLDTVHISNGFVTFKYAEAVMDNCDDDPFFGGVSNLAIRSRDCKNHLSLSTMTLYKEGPGEQSWQAHQYKKGEPEFTMAGTACNWAYPKFF